MYKIHSLNLVKFLLALNIFLIHVEKLWPHYAWPDGSSAFFFVLSGFGLATGYGHKVTPEWNNRKFFVSRLWRFYPLHLITLALCSALMWSMGTPEGVGPIVSNALLVQSWIPIEHFYFSGNWVSWFLSSLFFCYLLFAWLYRWLMHTTAAKMWLRFGAMVAAYLLVAVLCPKEWENAVVYVNPLMRVPNFAAGIVAFRLCVMSQSMSRHAGAWLAAIAAAAVAMWMAGPSLPFSLRCSSWWWPFSVLVIVGLYMAEKRFPAMAQFFDRRVFALLGSLSFTFYMWHQVVIRAYESTTLPLTLHAPCYLILAALLAIVLLLSWASNKFFTRPLVARFAPSTRR